MLTGPEWTIWQPLPEPRAEGKGLKVNNVGLRCSEVPYFLLFCGKSKEPELGAA